jgi:hypothetical protein
MRLEFIPQLLQKEQKQKHTVLSSADIPLRSIVHDPWPWFLLSLARI